MSLPKRLPCALLLLACVPLFAACSPARESPIVTKIERVPVVPPAELLACPAEPSRPADETDQDQLADWLVDLAMAGRTCRERLGSVKRFVEEVSK